MVSHFYNSDFVLGQAKYFFFCLDCNMAFKTHFNLYNSVIIWYFFKTCCSWLFFSIASWEAEILLVACIEALTAVAQALLS